MTNFNFAQGSGSKNTCMSWQECLATKRYRGLLFAPFFCLLICARQGVTWRGVAWSILGRELTGKKVTAIDDRVKRSGRNPGTNLPAEVKK